MVSAVFKTVGRLEKATAGSIPASSETLKTKKSSQSSLSQLPQIERLLEADELKYWFPRLSRPLVARLAAETIEEARERIQAGEAFPGAGAIVRPS